VGHHPERLWNPPLALENGYRESAKSWRTVLRDLKRRGIRAPVLAISDGALGFWGAMREVWPETAEQCCWVHRITDVLNKCRRASLQPRAKQALHALLYAGTRVASEREIRRFTAERGARYPEAVAALTTDHERVEDTDPTSMPARRAQLSPPLPLDAWPRAAPLPTSRQVQHLIERTNSVPHFYLPPCSKYTQRNHLPGLYLRDRVRSRLCPASYPLDRPHEIALDTAVRCKRRQRVQSMRV
jgi:hypothetical protein